MTKRKLPEAFQKMKQGALTWELINADEYRLLDRAQDGNPFPLAEFIASGGELRTHEVRQWVAARLRGEKLPKGSKRTMVQIMAEIETLKKVMLIRLADQVSEYRAIQILCDREPNLKVDTVRTHLRRAKATAQRMAEEDRQNYSGSEYPES